MNKVINYISYQSFPAETANSLQTISNLKYLKKNDYEIRLFFPLRENNSSDDIKIIQEYYLLNQEITVSGVKHPYPFGKIKYFNKLLFHISHYLWAKSTTAKFNDDKFKNDIIQYSAGGLRDFTRIAASDPVMWRDIFIDNSENILKVLDSFSENLEEIKKAIQNKDGKKLINIFSSTRKLRKEIIKAGQETDKPNFGRK